MTGQNFIVNAPATNVAVVAPGWSLTQQLCDELSAQPDMKIIAIGGAYKLLPAADIIYHADTRWWINELENGTVKDHPARKVSMGQDISRKGKVTFESAAHLGIDYLKQSSRYIGVDVSTPGAVVMGNNSGYQAIGIAAHFRPRNLLLLGFDLRLDPREGENKGKAHFDGDHVEGVYRRSPYTHFVQHISSMSEDLAKLNISVYNCNTNSALECFPKMGLSECILKHL